MNEAHIKEKMQRIRDLADSIADDFQHHLNIHASTGVPAAGVGQLCRVVRIIETAERTARDFHAILDHPAGVGSAALAGVVADGGRLEPHAGASPRLAAGDG